MNENLEKFRELLTINPELKERIAAEKKRLEESGAAAGEEAMLAASRSVSGLDLTMEDLKSTKSGPQELMQEDMEKVSDGTAFTAGGYNANYRFRHPTACPKCLEEGEKTGNEREEEYLWGLFSKHQVQYHCKKCNEYWWLNA